MHVASKRDADFVFETAAVNFGHVWSWWPDAQRCASFCLLAICACDKRDFAWTEFVGRADFEDRSLFAAFRHAQCLRCFAQNRQSLVQLRAQFDLAQSIDTEATRTTTPQEMIADIVKSIPLSRMGTPYDLVGMCLFLLSDQAKWITGQIFNVDGGQILN